MKEGPSKPEIGRNRVVEPVTISLGFIALALFLAAHEAARGSSVFIILELLLCLTGAAIGARLGTLLKERRKHKKY